MEDFWCDLLNQAWEIVQTVGVGYVIICTAETCPSACSFADLHSGSQVINWSHTDHLSYLQSDTQGYFCG